MERARSTDSSDGSFRNVPTIGGPERRRSRRWPASESGTLIEAEETRGVVADHLAQVGLAHAEIVETREQLLEGIDRQRVVHLTEIAADARAIGTDEIDPLFERARIPVIELGPLVVHAALVLEERARLRELADLLARRRDDVL